MPIFGTQFLYVPEVTVFLGLVFIVFNTYSGIYVYNHGNKQARFFLVGWAFLLVGYTMMIFDALGFISIMNRFPELILWITVIEALFLMLAFVDKLNILTSQKNTLDKKLLDEMNSRQKIIESEVIQRTSELNIALEEKEVLFREVHHRVKNNLQLILSIIRLQRFDLKNHQNSSEFEKLEHRIKAISKTHELLCDSNDIVEINMKDYIQELYNEISESIIDKDIKLDLDVDATMYLNQAVYVGLIINELISNSVKHAFAEETGEICIHLHKKDNEYTLCVGDSGKGYDENRLKNGSLGLKLVNSLAIHQLEGKIHLETTDSFKCFITFHV
jgi:two-component sensor histidine kinase